MPNVAAVLREEISRLSKKVVRQHVGDLRATVLKQKSQVTALKKQVAQLQREVGQLKRQAGKAKANASEPEEEASKFRFTAKGLKSIRARLGLSAENFGKLVGVGAQTVYSWESEKTQPRRTQIPAIVALRGMGKREAWVKIESRDEGAT